MDIDIGRYFKEKHYDDKLLDFIRFDVKTPKKTKYKLQMSTAKDEESLRLQRFYQLGIDLKLKYTKRKLLKKQGPVSYTHLDVYKRQGGTRLMPFLKQCRDETIATVETKNENKN